MFPKTLLRSSVMRTAAATVALLVTLGPVAVGQQSEGIKVHGDWTIEIHEPDGRLVSRQEFKNGLLSTGSAILADLLAGTHQITGWRIGLLNVNPSLRPCDECDYNAVIQRQGTTLVLSATATAERGGAINQVVTAYITTTVSLSFTRALLEQSILVAAGQIIQVKVVISFS